MKKLIDLIKTDRIIKVTPSESLSSALAKLSTSHDAAFVFKTKGEFVGIINPYHCLIKSSLPGNAKLDHCIFHPPKIYVNDSLDKVVRFIIESKIHYLPVFNDKEVLQGIVSSRHLLEEMKDDTRFNVPIEKVLTQKKRALVSVFEDDPLSTALSIFKKEKLSKIVVIDANFKLKGILSYYDLIHFLMSPKEKEKSTKDRSRDGLNSQKVKKFSKSFVLTLTKKDTMATALRMIIEKKIGSIVITDAEKHPTGIITTRDFLLLVMRPIKPVPFELIEKNLSTHSKLMAMTFFKRMKRLVLRNPKLERAQLLVREEHEGGLFQVVLSMFPKGGKPAIIKKEGRTLPEIFKKMKK